MPRKPASNLGALNQIVPSPSRYDDALSGLPDAGSVHTIITLAETTTFSSITEAGTTQRAATFAGAALPRGTVITSAAGITAYTADAPVAAYFND